jgi:predicted nucleic acid-binding protein
LRVADSSIAVAAFADWHPHHDVAHRAVLDAGIGVAAHAAFETYSVLTRLPEPHMMHAAVVHTWLEDTFADRWLALSADGLRLALERLRALGVAGGATYDGLIAITAAANEATIVTLDRRALATYALVGADVELVA